MDTQVVSILSAAILALPVVHAQVAPAPVVPVPVEDKKAAEPFDASSSSKMIGEQKIEWIEKMRSALPIATREIGPFGMPQNPNVEVARPSQPKPTAGAFLKAISAIKITTVMPSDKKFIIGSREFREGDAFPIIRDQRQFNIKVVKVGKNSILFQNVDTGEQETKDLNTLPKGMRRNAALDTVPGVVPANRKNKVPLNLDDDSDQ